MRDAYSRTPRASNRCRRLISFATARCAQRLSAVFMHLSVPLFCCDRFVN